MTEERLESYIGIVKEIAQLEGYIADGAPVVQDVVQSAAESPYNLHSVPIEGCDIKQLEQWKQQLADDKIKRDEIRGFIESVPDEKLRLAMRYKYYEGKPWQTVAMRCGWIDKDTPRKKIIKYIGNPLNSPKPAL